MKLMGIYDGIKDVAKVMQQADNIELYQKLLDLSAQALDMQDEIAKLREENKELKDKNIIFCKIMRHVPKDRTEPYITLSDDETEIKYCARCFEIHNKLIQLDYFGECPQCITERVRKA